MATWVLLEEKADIEGMGRALGVSETMAQVLVNRFIDTPKKAAEFLNPTFDLLHDAALIDNLQAGIDLVVGAVANSEKIAIYGDYDVDGVASTVILYKTLKNYGADVIYYIPQREEEGYGLNVKAVRALHGLGVDLIFTCDNGISSVNEVEEAKALGMKVLILDHHEPPAILPDADVIIDLKCADSSYPFPLLCAAGLSFRFAWAFYQHTGAEFANGREFLVFAMIATFCDIVDLRDENRVLAKNGLNVLNKNKKINKGLYALLCEKGVQDKPITEFEVGFILGPCINAAGRLGRADLAVDLFLSDDDEAVRLAAKELSQLNELRKEMTTEAVDKAKEILLADYSAQKQLDSVVVFYDYGIHESIAGIVAGRLKEIFFHPTIVLTKGDLGAKGSGRSIEGYNMFEELVKCQHLLERFGGHPMAAGLSLKEENISLLREELNKNCSLNKDDFVEKVAYDKILALEDATYQLATELLTLMPFGKGNRPPLFMTSNVCPESIVVLEEKNTILFNFNTEGSYRKIKGVCFGLVERFAESIAAVFDDYDCQKIMAGMLRNIPIMMDIVYSLEINEYNGNISVQMKIRDFFVRKGV